MRDLPGVVAQREQGESAVFELHIAADCPWFEGHFEGKPILPGVVQVGWAAHFAEQTWGFAAPPVTLERIKFRHPIVPGTRLTLELTRLPGKVRYQFLNDGLPVSSGVLCFGDA